MKSPRFHLTEAARASLKAIGRYTQKQWGKTQRDLYLRALDKQCRSLASFPMKGQPRDEIANGMRSYGEGKHVIYYFVEKKHILIVDILHERMDPLVHIRD